MKSDSDGTVAAYRDIEHHLHPFSQDVFNYRVPASDALRMFSCNIYPDFNVICAMVALTARYKVKLTVLPSVSYENYI